MHKEYNLAYVLSKKHSLSLLSFLVYTPEIRYTDIRDTTRMNELTMLSRLKELTSVGLVERSVSEDRTTMYTASSFGLKVYFDCVLPSMELIRKSREQQL